MGFKPIKKLKLPKTPKQLLNKS